jgi:hypothetical protein
MLRIRSESCYSPFLVRRALFGNWRSGLLLPHHIVLFSETTKNRCQRKKSRNANQSRSEASGFIRSIRITLQS